MDTVLFKLKSAESQVHMLMKHDYSQPLESDIAIPDVGFGEPSVLSFSQSGRRGILRTL